MSPAQSAPFAAIVMDARSGEVLYEKNADTRLHPASLTKMMTLYIVFQEIEAGRLSLDDMVTVTKNAAAQPPSRLGLRPGQKIAVRYLIRAAAVKSANDAAAALGDHLGGSPAAFGKRMTRTARALGMSNSTFKNANGLTTEGHLSTARDMTILGRHLFYDFPQFYNIFSRRTADAGMARVTNTNSRFLDAYEGADGIKTGYTVAAGFNLTASAVRGNKRIIATVFGGTSTAARNSKMAELMDLGFGAARDNVRTKAPAAAPVPPANDLAEDLVVADAAPPPVSVSDDMLAEAASVDVPDVAGGAAKTIRVSGAVQTSIRPKGRPATAEVPDEVALAIASSVDDALGEALAEPAPAGTLEAQVQGLAAGKAPAAIEEDGAVQEVAEAVVDKASAKTAAPPADTLESQAVALADTAADATLESQAVALAAPAAEDAPVIDKALATTRPQARPETKLAEATVDKTTVEEPALEEVAVAEAPVETAVEAIEPVDIAEAASAPEIPTLTDVETVAAAVMAPLPDPAPGKAAKPARNAPIFESPKPVLQVAAVATKAEAPVEEDAAEVVVVKSSSGGRHWGVNVGNFTSRSNAERALLKTALAESATLNQSLRKISQKSGSYHANFMGLTEEQATLACRRLKARGVPCETLGPA